MNTRSQRVPNDMLITEMEKIVALLNEDTIKVNEIKKLVINISKNLEKIKSKIEKEKKKSKILEKLKPKYDEIIKKSQNFKDWDEKRELLRYAIIMAIYCRINDLKTNQIRKVLDLANRTHLKLRRNKNENIESDLAKMCYILAYTAGRNQAVEPLANVLDIMLQNADNKSFNKLYDFIQAVVAYHKFFGGGE
ncbi:CRISPR-associated protein, Csm2 family [Methanocaldococcus vulcanius M7]|uniref:CRISPR system Cms protein Csm2 n=1 Tax=Methanocaldococcus vulcanius (strain ATCC 700851 / DSM 12094 / M7) TaxID=579137 RepID=C9RHM7_METVM|nr:type III-A CRISPR-associated protein Csm2 [Methanocaldococcus vulcanius]ACX73079.1 CRISPR-associated protein, Csm2 family [Methanocaldococcus vulcanius M7]